MAAVVAVVQIRIVQSFISKECVSQAYSTVVAQGISYHNGSSKVLKLGSTSCGRGMWSLRSCPNRTSRSYVASI
jgi:hypothetical protein